MNPILPSSVSAGREVVELKLENFYLEIAEPGGLGAELCCDRAAAMSALPARVHVPGESRASA